MDGQNNAHILVFVLFIYWLLCANRIPDHNKLLLHWEDSFISLHLAHLSQTFAYSPHYRIYLEPLIHSCNLTVNQQSLCLFIKLILFWDGMVVHSELWPHTKRSWVLYVPSGCPSIFQRKSSYTVVCLGSFCLSALWLPRMYPDSLNDSWDRL